MKVSLTFDDAVDRLAAVQSGQEGARYECWLLFLDHSDLHVLLAGNRWMPLTVWLKLCEAQGKKGRKYAASGSLLLGLCFKADLPAESIGL